MGHRRSLVYKVILLIPALLLILSSLTGPTNPVAAQGQEPSPCSFFPSGGEFGSPDIEDNCPEWATEMDMWSCCGTYRFSSAPYDFVIFYIQRHSNPADAGESYQEATGSWQVGPSQVSPLALGDEGLEYRYNEQEPPFIPYSYELMFRRGPYNVSTDLNYYLLANRSQADFDLKIAKMHAIAAQIDANIKSAQPGVSANRLPVILIPGVAGTVLFSTGQGEVWPLAPQANRMDMTLNPDGKTPATGAGIYVGDIIRRSGPMNFYGGMMNYLTQLGYKEGTDLFTLPYDWRLSNDEHFVRLDETINAALEKTGSKKVILVAHSMGGLIARAYVLSNPVRAGKVDSFITMGTPYWGAPKVYYALINGYQFGNPTVRQELMKILSQNMAAAYQLLPRVPFIQDTASNRPLSLEESYGIRYKWFEDVIPGIMRDKYVVTAGNTQTFNSSLLQKAEQFHASSGIKQAPVPPPAGVKQYVIIGQGVKTLAGYNLRDWQPGLVFYGSYLELADRREVILEPVFLDGDGTVPMWSLETSGATATYYVPYTGDSSAHGDLPSNRTVQAIVGQILSGKPPSPVQYPNTYPKDYREVEGGVISLILGLGYSTDFTLHSAAHLKITDGSGGALGFNSQGGIDENLPTGTFLNIDGVEYTSIADPNRSYNVSVTAVNDGQFQLTAKTTKDGTITTFSYPEVTVKVGDVAQLSVTPSQVTANMPPLVANDGKNIEPVISDVTSVPQEPPSSDETGKESGPCFIATAAYGSETAAELDVLRAFRDRVLMSSSPGRQFVAAYYRYSPPAAGFVAGHQGMKTLVRELILNPLVALLENAQFIWDD